MTRLPPKDIPPVEATCATCGCAFTIPWSPQGGRPPRHCEVHRRAPRPAQKVPVTTSARAIRARAVAREVRSAEDVARPAEDVARLAAGLRVHADPRAAAQLVGLDIPEADLVAMAELARTQYPDIVSGSPAGLARAFDAAMAVGSASLLTAMKAAPPKDLPHMLQALAKAKELLLGKDREPVYSHVELVMVGADGKALSMLPPVESAA